MNKEIAVGKAMAVKHGKHVLAHQMKRDCKVGSWLGVIHSKMNETELCVLEFRNNLRLCYGLCPLDLQEV